MRPSSLAQAITEPESAIAPIIADVLDLTVEEALEFFDAVPRIKGKLQTLHDVGLGYIHLGQPATTLSGGEAQRVKLAVEIAKTARFAGVERLVAISAEGADRWSRDRHLSAKGKAETELSRLGFKRLDIVRPGPLAQRKGSDGAKRSRISALRGRGTDVDTVARALMTLSLRRTPGKFTHDEEGIERAAAMLSRAPSAKDGSPAEGGIDLGGQQQAQQG